MKRRIIAIWLFFLVTLSCFSSASLLDLFKGGMTVTALAIKNTCTDTEKGESQYTFGTATYNGADYADTCKSDTKLTEYYCSLNKLKQKSYTCKKGCKDGVCINCYDSDAGKNIFTKGSAYLYSNPSRKNTDTCVNAKGASVSKGDTILEYYCQNNVIASSKEKCPCGNGICTIPKLSATMTTPIEGSVVKAYSGEIEAIVQTTVKAKCEYALYSRVLGASYTPMKTVDGMNHIEMISYLQPENTYILDVNCYSSDGQSMNLKTSFMITIPEINGNLGILTDNDFYMLDEKIRLI